MLSILVGVWLVETGNNDGKIKTKQGQIIILIKSKRKQETERNKTFYNEVYMYIF